MNELFGEYVTKALDAMPPNIQAKARLALQTTLFGSIY
jgi:hypothetical protein